MKTLEQLGISPAPWKFVPGDETTHAGIDDATGGYVAETATNNEEVENADARIMHAAPKMYKALLECERKLAAIEPYYRNLLKMVREVLEEAGGAE